MHASIMYILPAYLLLVSDEALYDRHVAICDIRTCCFVKFSIGTLLGRGPERVA